MGDWPRICRNRSSSDEREAPTWPASVPTVQRRAGSLWIAARAGARMGSRRAAIQPWSIPGAVARWGAQHLGQHELGKTSGERVGREVRQRRRVRQRIVDAGLDPPRRRTAQQSHDEDRGQRPEGGVEEGIGGVQEAAHHLGTPPAAAVAEKWHLGPWQRVDQGQDRDALRRALATHDVVVRIGQHDDVARVGPVANAVVDRDPARSRGHDVEQRQAVRSRHDRVGEGERSRLELERVGELGAEEERSVEAEVVQRGRCGIGHAAQSGVAASRDGAAVMGFRAVSRDHAEASTPLRRSPEPCPRSRRSPTSRSPSATCR